MNNTTDNIFDNLDKLAEKIMEEGIEGPIGVYVPKIIVKKILEGTILEGIDDIPPVIKYRDILLYPVDDTKYNKLSITEKELDLKEIKNKLVLINDCKAYSSSRIIIKNNQRKQKRKHKKRRN